AFAGDFFYVVRRPALVTARRSELYRKIRLAVFEDGAEERGDRHPENGSRAAYGYCDGDAGDIADAERAGKRDGQRRKRRNTAFFFSVLCITMSFISGSFVQMNAASSALKMTYGAPKIAAGAVFAAVCLLVALGGIARVSAFTSAAMPLFCAVFAAVSVIAISIRINDVPAVIARIFSEAFGVSQVTGGFSGAVIAAGIREGMTKGVFSHEAGCGTSSFSHAASSLESPSAQGVIGVLEVLVDTLFFGGLTALVILLSPAGKGYGGYDGAALSISAYSYFFGEAAEHILTVLTVFFAFATVLCWAYYGCCCVRFVFKSEKYVKIYLFLYCISTAAGSVISASVIWQISDILCALLLAVNCVCMIKGRRYFSV
ncbi:MAG: sodium:alanine symporter family protein, partial [Clostridia bacterium]|nr:sodium:alanine symporter family protein [Clostridia bacterium]